MRAHDIDGVLLARDKLTSLKSPPEQARKKKRIRARPASPAVPAGGAAAMVGVEGGGQPDDDGTAAAAVAGRLETDSAEKLAVEAESEMDEKQQDGSQEVDHKEVVFEHAKHYRGDFALVQLLGWYSQEKAVRAAAKGRPMRHCHALLSILPLGRHAS